MPIVILRGLSDRPSRISSSSNLHWHVMREFIEYFYPLGAYGHDALLQHDAIIDYRVI